jgi:hypothetical protein
MNPTGLRYSKCLSIALLAGAFVMSSELPLMATPQTTQSNTASASNTGQKPDDSLPDAPQAQDTQTPASQQPVPSGAAGAKAANVKGAPVAQPAGAAVAPARQRGHHSLLIKVGLVAGAAIAVGAAVALSERSPSRPPGVSSASATRP